MKSAWFQDSHMREGTIQLSGLCKGFTMLMLSLEVSEIWIRRSLDPAFGLIIEYETNTAK